MKLLRPLAGYILYDHKTNDSGTPWPTDWMHTGQDRWIQTELAFTLAKNATKPNPFEIISLQTTRKKDSWKTKETLARAVVTLKTERNKGSNPWCLWWRWSAVCRSNFVNPRLRPACQRPACTRFHARADDWRFCVLRDSDRPVAQWRQWERAACFCWRIVP
jgi:hypothetical protein